MTKDILDKATTLLFEIDTIQDNLKDLRKCKTDFDAVRMFISRITSMSPETAREENLMKELREKLTKILEGVLKAKEEQFAKL